MDVGVEVDVGVVVTVGETVTAEGGVVVGVPDSVGASVGVAGALLGTVLSGEASVRADIDFHSSQLTAQSQMSPSA